MADKLCPPLIAVITEVAKDDDNQPLNKYILRKAKGSIMFCLPYDDITTLPADIGDQIIRTARYLNGELAFVINKLRDSLTKTCEEQKKRSEGFKDTVEKNVDISANLSSAVQKANDDNVTIPGKPDPIVVASAIDKSKAAFDKQSADVDSPDPTAIMTSINNSKEVVNKDSTDTTSKNSPEKLDPMRELICEQRITSMYVAISSAGDFAGNLASIESQYVQLKYFLKNPTAIKSLC